MSDTSLISPYAEEQGRIRAEVERLGLADYAAELDLRGYTLVPPSVTGMTDDFIDRVRERALDLIGERDGVRPDPATGESRRGHATPGLYWSFAVEFVATLVDSSPLLLDTSVLHHLAPAPAADPRWVPALVMTGIGLLGAAVGVQRFTHRDLAGP